MGGLFICPGKPAKRGPAVNAETSLNNKNDGCGDHTRVYIANTRRSAQFSLGGANLTHRASLTSILLGGIFFGAHLNF
jgi:hypothetical protein